MRALIITVGLVFALGTPVLAPTPTTAHSTQTAKRVTEDSAEWQCWRMGNGYCDKLDREVKRA